jgi:carboxyl-terminal processing protease
MTVNKWILIQMIIIIMLSFFLGYKTHQLEQIDEKILPEWIANSSIGEFVFARSDSDGIVNQRDMKEVQNILELVQRNHIDNAITKRELIDGAIAGGVSATHDQYSRYVPKQESREVAEDIVGFYGGIGILVEPVSEGKGCLVTSVFKNAPAFDVGIMAGDMIIEVDGKDVADLFLHEIVAKLKGPEDTKVKVKVIRTSIQDTLEFDVVRKKVKYPSVFEYKILEGTDGMGYINLIQFNNESTRDMKAAIDDLVKQGMKSLVLDIRQNTGGSFMPATEIADMFIDSGIMVYTVDRDGNTIEYKGKDKGEKLGIPLVVLVDQFSASASEILAGAIKDHKAGTIIGSRTFGKGVVQNVSTLPEGGTLILTISKYLTPNKTDINKKGIYPDILAEVDFEKTSDPFLKEKYQKAEQIRQDYIALRDEIIKYLRDHDFPLQVAKDYLTTGKIPSDASFLTEEDITRMEKEREEATR